MSRVEQSLTKQIRELLSKRLVERKDLQPDSVLAEANIDSIDLAFVFSHFEQQYAIRFENEEINISRYDTIQDVAQMIANRIGGGISS